MDWIIPENSLRLAPVSLRGTIAEWYTYWGPEIHLYIYIYICTPRCETNMNVKRPVHTHQTSISSMLNNMIKKWAFGKLEDGKLMFTKWWGLRLHESSAQKFFVTCDEWGKPQPLLRMPLKLRLATKKSWKKKRPCFILSECKHLICIPVTRFLSAQYLDLKTGESQRSTATHRFPKTWSNHSLFRCDDLGSVENPITKQPQFAFMATVYHGIPLFGMI